MKIGPHDNLPAAAAAAAAADRKAAGPASARPVSESSAKVDLSEAATLKGDAAGNVQFDQAKVDRIAQAIRDGRFSVDADAIADKLIANARELLVRNDDR
ncbi:MAG: flagellar biosynthesis anti-sigma factor FlgM [Rubrivivax sp.]